MGQNSVTDVLTISLSVNNIQGHQFGPDSDARREMIVRLDQDPDSFFSYIDKKIGLENVMVALTADHGIAPIPTESAMLGVASARLDLDALRRRLTKL
jgi:predicted AlkP superfamily pyrophosphatase or phosphodiesterase